MQIHLAGCESLHFAKAIVYTGHRHVLLSYHYLKSRSDDKRMELIKYINDSGLTVILDSGIFTMMFGSGKDKTYDLLTMTAYAEEYLARVKTWGIKNLTVVECDVHKILGMDAVFKLRSLFEKSGLRVMYVWHLEEGTAGLEAMAKKYHLLGIGCPELRLLFKGRDQTYKAAVWDLLGRIKSHSANLPKVHLLGNTVMETMETHQAWSCDSTSWISGVKFGRSHIFNHGRIITAHLRSPAFIHNREILIAKNPAFKEWVHSEFETDVRREYYYNLYSSAMAFKLYQEWLNKKFAWSGSEKKLSGRI